MMVNKLYSALTESVPSTGQEYYGKYRTHVQVPSIYKNLVKALVPEGTSDAMAFRASVLIHLISYFPELNKLLQKADPESTYNGLPQYRDTTITYTEGYSTPYIKKALDCREPYVTGTLSSTSDKFIISTNVSGVLTVPTSQTTVLIPKAYQLTIPPDWNTGGAHIISFTITGTPVHPVWADADIKPFANMLDADLSELVDPDSLNSLCAALCVQVARSINE